MKEKNPAERALKAVSHFRKDVAGAVSLDAASFADILARSAQYWANDDDVCVIARSAESGKETFERYGKAARSIVADDGSLGRLFDGRDFACREDNDGSLLSGEYRSWLELPMTGKKETHLVAIVARKGRKFSREEKDAGKELSAYFGAALKDVRARNRKAAAITEETERRLLLCAQGTIGRKSRIYPGFFQLSDYGARAGSDFAEMWHAADEGIVACSCDVTASDAERHLGIVYLDTWFSILARTTLGMREMVSRLNADMAAKRGECYASLAGVRYSRGAGIAEIAGCGSATAMHFRHETMSADVFRFGPAAGIRKDAEIKSYAIEPKTGDIICLCTDGLTSARRQDGNLVGPETVAEAIRRHYYLASEDLAAKILETVAVASAHGANEDDRTVQILKIL
jgi:hypothetical protein